MIVGLIAGVLTTACWVPQLVRSIKGRNVDSFSWWYLCTIATGIALWFSYGVIRRDVDIELPNALTFLAVLVLMLVKAGEELRVRRLAPPSALEAPRPSAVGAVRSVLDDLEDGAPERA